MTALLLSVLVSATLSSSGTATPSKVSALRSILGAIPAELHEACAATGRVLASAKERAMIPIAKLSDAVIAGHRLESIGGRIERLLPHASLLEDAAVARIETQAKEGTAALHAAVQGLHAGPSLRVASSLLEQDGASFAQLEREVAGINSRAKAALAELQKPFPTSYAEVGRVNLNRLEQQIRAVGAKAGIPASSFAAIEAKPDVSLAQIEHALRDLPSSFAEVANNMATVPSWDQMHASVLAQEQEIRAYTDRENRQIDALQHGATISQALRITEDPSMQVEAAAARAAARSLDGPSHLTPLASTPSDNLHAAAAARAVAVLPDGGLVSVK